MTEEKFEERVAITGVGQSQVGRRLGRSGLELTAEAAKAAVADAGLSFSDIDGLATYPGFHPAPGFGPVGVFDAADALGLELDWFLGAPQAPGQFGPILDAMMAVACGLATHVLCFRTTCEATAQGDRGRSSVVTPQSAAPTAGSEWLVPFGAPSAVNWIALYAQRHFAVYGTTREQLAWIAINARRHAALNPAAIYRDALTHEDYMSARMISTPLCLYDCDVPADGSVAVIVSRRDRSHDLRKPPLAVEAVGCGLRGRAYWDQWEDMTTMAARDAAAMLWRRTDLKPADVDAAELYDGFSMITVAWLEALGFCGKGEAGAFVEGGDRISIGGELPLNTHGGQLSGGRTHGFGFLHEACRQLWGEGAERQVDRAQVALASAGGGPLAGCILLTSDG